MLRRAFTRVLTRHLREFPATILIGLRQVGKTTIVRAQPKRSFITLDDIGVLDAARRDPAGFVAGLPRPVTIDEVQRAPELLLPIKAEVDKRRRSGEFLLTGSAQIELRRGARETLAGRAALLRLRPMTWSERALNPEWNPVDALFACRSVAVVVERFRHGKPFDPSQVLAGGLPFPLLELERSPRARWFEQYQASYIERDVPPLLQLEEVSSFIRFLTLAASRTAQTTNYAALGHDVGISTQTAIRWSGVLETTFLIDLLPPFFRNIGKRLVKSPKLHIGDVGIAAHLVGATSWKIAQDRNLAGPLLETLVAQHLLAFCETSTRRSSLFHYRTNAGAEADFVVSRAERLIPIEVKSSTTVRSNEARGLSSFIADHNAPFGVLLHTGTEAFPLAKNVAAIPVTALLEGPAAD